MLNVLYARPTVRLSVCHTGGSIKMVEVMIVQLSAQSSPIPPEILKGSPWGPERGRQTRVGSEYSCWRCDCEECKWGVIFEFRQFHIHRAYSKAVSRSPFRAFLLLLYWSEKTSASENHSLGKCQRDTSKLTSVKNRAAKNVKLSQTCQVVFLADRTDIHCIHAVFGIRKLSYRKDDRAMRPMGVLKIFQSPWVRPRILFQKF